MSHPAGLRTESTHHRLYEFAKSALVKIFVHPYATVGLPLSLSLSNSLYMYVCIYK